MSRTTSDDDDDVPPPPPQTSGVFTRTGSGTRRTSSPGDGALGDDLAQMLQAEQRLTRAVAEQTQLMRALEARLVRRAAGRRENCGNPV